MHVSKANAPPKEARRDPVNSSAHQSIRNTEQRKAHSKTHKAQPPSEAEGKLALSNFALTDASVPFSRLPVFTSVPTLPQRSNGPNSSGRRPSDNGLRPNQHLILPSLAPRRDSVFRSSDDSADDDDSLRSFSNSQSSECGSKSISLHPTRITRPICSYHGLPSSSITRSSPRQAGVPALVEDTDAGAEAKRWNSDELASSGHSRSYSKESWNSVRGYTSSLGPPALRILTVSPKLSVANISDAGDQQQLRQERTLPHAEDSFDDDLKHSLALLPPLGARYELQKEILEARQKTRDNEGQVKKFVSKAKLRHVITVDAVTRELTRTSAKFHPPLSPERIKGYAKRVCIATEEEERGRTRIKSFRKIFALLVLVEAVPSIVDFVREDVSDQDLPLTLVRYQGTDELYRKGDENRVPLRCFSDWSPLKLENFQNYQWWLLATYFSPPDADGVVKNYKLQDEHILPFVTPKNALDQCFDKTGGYGKVIMVQIPSDHHNFSDKRLCERGFAIKQQLNDENREAYKKEIDILMKFSGGRSHPHIVSLLATYEQFNKFHLIFYRAEGDLFDYWKRLQPNPSLNHSNVIWFAKQCSGLAEGLSKLHRLLSFTKPQPKTQEQRIGDVNDAVDDMSSQLGKSVRFHMTLLKDRVGTDSSILSNGVRERPTSPPRYTDDVGDRSLPPRGHQAYDSSGPQKKVYGRHGDINPSNILWYDDGDGDNDSRTLQGILKITDFGQAEIHSLQSKTNRREVPNTLTYRPPECDLPPMEIRQSYDIWCLGCVYLEFVTWLLGGNELVTKFGRSRSIADYFRRYKTIDTFYEVEKDPDEAHGIRAKLNPKVTAFISKLHQHPDCTSYVHKLLNLIQFDMLLVDSRERKSCRDVWRSLDEMYFRCRHDEDYATMGSPWCNMEMAASSVQHYVTSNSEQAGQVIAPAVQSITSARRRPSLKTKKKHAGTPNLAYELNEDDLDGLLPPEASGSDLVGTILGRFVTATFHDPNRAYLPENAIKELIVQAAIEQELEKIEVYSKEHTARWDCGRRTQLATWIRTKAPKVFTIAIQCGFEPFPLLLAMATFRKCGFTDDKLPMVDSPPPQDVFHPHIWNLLKIDSFKERQWRCLVPVFAQRQYDYDLKAECIFPFTSDGAVPKDGAFSSVYRVTVHKDHHEYPEMQQVALKELKVPQGGEQAAGTDRAWNFEANALEAINKLDHTHIVKCIAAIRRGHSRYFMFPWADGDSLRDFWNNTPREAPNAYVIEHTILQLRGIADALDRLHNFDGGCSEVEKGVNGLTIRLNESNVGESHLSHGSDAGSDNGLDTEVDDYKNAGHAESIRHGDLKPENILRFVGNGSKSGLGTLKIADMGLAKRHVVATQERGKATSTRYGTRRYEAPETVTGENARSRLYDIWSMGCITFEFIIWILYGNDELSNFYKQIEGNAQQICQYYEVLDASEPESARVHPVVLKWMNHVQDKDPECSTGRVSATKDLLKIVREMLLVVNLPPNRKSGTTRGRPLLPPALGQSITDYRATAAQFRDALDVVVGKRDVPGYMFTGKDRTNVRTPTFTAPMLSPNSASLPLSNLQPSRPLKSGVLGRPIGVDYTLPPLKDWEFQIDNSFTDKIIDMIGVEVFGPKAHIAHQFCASCSTRNFLKGGFSIEEQVSTLEDRAPKCDLCRMLYEIHSQAEDSKGDRARFQRDQSSIVMTGDSYPVLSLIRHPNTEFLCPIQIGFPELPEAGSDTFFSIIKLWLEDCDTNHTGCQGISQSLPTRLLNVGTINAPMLRLVETTREHILSKKYIALSHPWGDTTKYTPFCTLQENLASHLHSIPEDDLPKTFQDAVRCTRRIGVRYLWVDSLCIIQGELGDFNDESKKMEAVFSGAYCVLAASRATNQLDGFLGPRPQREYITIQRGNDKPLFVCKTIDNFN
ncbi:hypothetical protein G6011_00444 [Alternaria panax]|uniref:Protein kinase domain-containing protein n=1 Tax=Alternaria panax TaxID=48097 RepID=A0AAD4NV06_9PLEO|nr:hypothetical protein G6011_00444 [Alternaria panax]